MDKLLSDQKHYCRAFIDNIIIFSDTLDNHLKYLDDIFTLFESRDIALSPAKSFIGYPSIELLGFYVNAFGLSLTAQRTQGFRDLVFPKTLKALETYLGAAGFLHTMILYFAQLSEPLQRRKVAMLAEGRKSGRLTTGNPNARAAYTRGRVFEPTAEELQSFNSLQEQLCNKLHLSHVDPDKPLFLQIDGSLEHGFGVMLFHLKPDFSWSPTTSIPSTAILPVMFLSRYLTKAELSYGPSELEVACLVWACKRLCTILHLSNHRIIVLTDHNATRRIVNQTTLNTTSTDRANRRLINASIYLSAYPLDVYHLPGRLNFVPDVLSRLEAVGDTQQRTRTAEPMLDNLWEKEAVLYIAEAQMSDDLKQQFANSYQKDTIY